jgi:predicted nuclease of predicted toxin-antitoxin system
MRFLVDVCVDIRVREWLREQGHDANHLRDEGLQKLPNGQIFVKAEAESRFIVTLDLDFGEILALAGDRIVSTIVFRVRDTRATALIARLTSVLPAVAADLMRGAIEIIEPARFRVRHLPLR